MVKRAVPELRRAQAESGVRRPRNHDDEAVSDLAVEWVPIDSIQGYEGNPRDNRAAIPKVAESIRRYGWRQPIVCDKDRVIVAGHTRWEGGRLLGETLVPVHFANDMTPEQAAAYASRTTAPAPRPCSTRRCSRRS